MKFFIQTFVLVTVTSSLCAMDVEPKELLDTGTFSSEYADHIKHDFHKLSTYLYKYSDCKKTLNKLYSQITDDSIGNWIDKHAVGNNNYDCSEINAVCLYFYARNYLEKIPTRSKNHKNFFKSQDFTLILVALMLCLQRTLFDSIRYYTEYCDEAVIQGKNGTYFGTYDPAYKILKKKFYHLLTQHLPSGTDFSKYPDFDKICTTTLALWAQQNFTHQEHPYHWVQNLTWSHWWMPVWSWGIYFGPDQIPAPTLKTRLINEETLDAIFEIVNSVFTQESSWTKFFSSFEFPVTTTKINEKIQLDIC